MRGFVSGSQKLNYLLTRSDVVEFVSKQQRREGEKWCADGGALCSGGCTEWLGGGAASSRQFELVLLHCER